MELLNQIQTIEQATENGMELEESEVAVLNIVRQRLGKDGRVSAFERLELLTLLERTKSWNKKNPALNRSGN